MGVDCSELIRNDSFVAESIWDYAAVKVANKGVAALGTKRFISDLATAVVKRYGLGLDDGKNTAIGMLQCLDNSAAAFEPELVRNPAFRQRRKLWRKLAYAIYDKTFRAGEHNQNVEVLVGFLVENLLLEQDQNFGAF